MAETAKKQSSKSDSAARSRLENALRTIDALTNPSHPARYQFLAGVGRNFLDRAQSAGQLLKEAATVGGRLPGTPVAEVQAPEWRKLASETAALGREFVRAPVKTTAGMFTSEFERAVNATQSPGEFGEYLASFVSPVRGVRPRRIIIGEKAATWNAEAAQRAKNLEADGYRPDQIYERTGTWRGPDKKWRQEISDDRMRYLPVMGDAERVAFLEREARDARVAANLRYLADSKSLPLDEAVRQWTEMHGAPGEAATNLVRKNSFDALQAHRGETERRLREFSNPSANPGYATNNIFDVVYHPELESAYPELSQIGHVYSPESMMGGAHGYFSTPLNTRGRGEIAVSQSISPFEARSTLGHELTHAVQNIEGFEGGSNPIRHQKLALEPRARALSFDFANELYSSRDAASQRLHDPSLIVSDGLQKIRDLRAINSGGAPARELTREVAALERVAKKYGFEDAETALKYLEAQDKARSPYGQYRLVGGEAEARAVEHRLNMTPEQRRAMPFLRSYDVGIHELIKP